MNMNSISIVHELMNNADTIIWKKNPRVKSNFEISGEE